MKALKKRAEADLIISRYNLQESLIFVEASSIAHTFQNGSKSSSECLTEAFEYLKKLRDEKTL